MTLIQGMLPDNSDFKSIIIDDDTGALITVDHIHHEIRQGDLFTASYTVPHGSEIANDASQDFLFVTANAEVHMLYKIAVGGDSEVLFYEDTTTSDNGTALAEINRDRGSTTVTAENAFHTPTVTGLGTLLLHTFVPGGSGPNASGDDTKSGTEWILDNATKYLIRVTNRSGGAIQVSAAFNWYQGK